METISPLFAIEAEGMLAKGYPEEAIDICNEGLLVYPEYTSVHGILTRAYKMLGRDAEAEEIIAKAIKNFPGNKVLSNISKKEFNKESEFFVKKIKGFIDYTNENTIQEFNDLKESSNEAPIEAFKNINLDEIEEELNDVDAKMHDIENLSSGISNIEIKAGNFDEFDDDEFDEGMDDDLDLDIDLDIDLDELDEDDEEGYEEDYEFFEEEEKEEDFDEDFDVEDLTENLYINEFESPMMVNVKNVEFKDSNEIIDSSNLNLIPGLESSSSFKPLLENKNYSSEFANIPDLLSEIVDKFSSKQAKSIDEIPKEAFKGKIEEISQKLEKIDSVKKVKKIKTENTVIPSETLAEIYLSQGAISESIKEYKKLSEYYPENVPLYKSKIKEIRSKS